MQTPQKIGIGMIVGVGILALIFFFGFRKPKPEEIPAVYQFPRLDKDYCNKLPSPKRDYCLDLIDYDEIAKGDDFEACFNLRTKKVREECLHGMARAFGNPEICFKIETEWYRKNCLTSVGIARLDFEICKYIPPEETWERKECHDQIQALRLPELGKEEDILKCKGLVLEYENLCLLNFYNTRFNFECEKVPREARDYCIFLTTIFEVSKTRNSKLCEKLENKSWNYYCLRVAQKGTAAMDEDTDKDNLDNAGEIFYGLDLFNPDADEDGFEDGEEIMLGTNPKDPATHPSYLKHPIPWLKKLFKK